MDAKRACDLAVASLLLAATAPLSAAVAALERLDGGPVFWRSPRAARGGGTFTLLQFRTMRPDGTLTPVGRVLRTSSLDHLPMLLNVLRGDLSLVGPRPTEPYRVDLADPAWQRVLTVRPGVTSLAVVTLARDFNTSPPARRLALELAYVESASLGYDLRLLGRAFAALVRSRGNIKARGRPQS